MNLTLLNLPGTFAAAESLFYLAYHYPLKSLRLIEIPMTIETSSFLAT